MSVSQSPLFAHQAVRYGLVGLLNTGLSFVVIATLTWAQAQPWVANACGYAVGLISSFFLNRSFTFRSSRGRSAVLPFLSGFAVCYAINLAVLLATAPMAGINALLPQLLAMLSYNVSFFVLMKWLVFAGLHEN